MAATRSAERTIDESDALVLFPGEGSAVLLRTVAVFDDGPSANAGSTDAIIVTLTVVPFTIVPMGHDTDDPAMLQVPDGQVAVVGVMPNGSVSATIDPVASEGPALRTARV